MQRSRTTPTPRSGLVSSRKMTSRSSMILVLIPRRSSSSSRSFSSTRTRERSTPTVGSLTPAFFGLRRERESDRRGGGHLELGTAVPAGHDLALDRVRAHGHVAGALGAVAGIETTRPPSAVEGSLARYGSAHAPGRPPTSLRHP